MNPSSTDPRTVIAAKAAEWIIHIDECELTRSDKRELLSWLRASPQHINEFLLATAMWQELDNLDGKQRVNIDELIAEAQQNIVVLDKPRQNNGSTNNPRKTRQWFMATAATLLLGFGLVFGLLNQESHFVTGVGEQLSFTLTDGSVIHLNTSSALDAKITKDERHITLLRGEAMFHVAKDPDRPFQVRSGPVVVEAIGTQFNVYQRNADTLVTVVEGKVSVLPTAKPQRPESTMSDEITAMVEKDKKFLSAGQEARVDHEGNISRLDETDIEKNVAWRDRRLVFRGETLSVAAMEFNRYNRQQFVIRNPSALTRQITATFNADDPESFISFLERDSSIVITRNNQQIIIARR